MPRKKKAPAASFGETYKAPATAGAPPDFQPILAVCADVHLGNHPRWGGPLIDGLNRRGRETVAVLERAVRAAEAAGCSAFAVAGDLLHTRRPEPALIAAVQRVFSSTKMAVLLAPGNHDCLDASAAGGNTAMAPLWKDATVVNETSWFTLGDLNVLVVPFDGRQPMADWIEAELERVGDQNLRGPRVLVTHVGVFDEEGAAPWQLKAKDGVAAERLRIALTASGFHGCFVGNYHNHRTWLDSPLGSIVQVGTLCPASFSDPEEGVGRLALTDGAHVRFEEVPGPRFRTALAGQSWDRAPIGLHQDGWHYYVRVRDPKEPDPADVARAEAAGFTIDWAPDQAATSGGAGPGPISQTPEDALRAACAEVPKDLADDVEALVFEAWARSA